MAEKLSIKVPTARKVRLEALASKRKMSLSRLMLQVLERLLRESETVSPVSCFEPSGDLFEKAENLDARFYRLRLQSKSGQCARCCSRATWVERSPSKPARPGLPY